MMRRRCLSCGLIKVMKRRDQICCSRSCGMIFYSRKLTEEFKQKRSQKGGVTQGIRQAQRRESLYESLVQRLGLTGACRRIYRNGYAAGFHARHYAECVDSHRKRYDNVE